VSEYVFDLLNVMYIFKAVITADLVSFYQSLLHSPGYAVSSSSPQEAFEIAKMRFLECGCQSDSVRVNDAVCHLFMLKMLLKPNRLNEHIAITFVCMNMTLIDVIVYMHLTVSEFTVLCRFQL